MKRIATLIAAVVVSAAAIAQSLPNKPVHLIVAYPPGGVSDAVARTLADKLAPQLGLTVLVDNKGGASGAIGLDAVAKAAPDGSTIGFSAISPVSLSPHLGKVPYDPQKDLAPVAGVMVSPVLVLATSATSARDFKELLGQARQHPGAVRWSTSGPASLGHIMLEQLKAAAGVDITHIPYKGGGQQITDAIGGQFEILSVNASPGILQQVKSGKLRALAIGAPRRMDALPDVPTLAELGYPQANLMSVFGIFAPGRTPAAIIEKLNAETNKALQSPEVRDRLVAAGNMPMGGTAAAFAAQIAQESQANARIVRSAGIKAD